MYNCGWWAVVFLDFGVRIKVDLLECGLGCPREFYFENS